MCYFYPSANGGGGININMTKYSTASTNAIMLIDRFCLFLGSVRVVLHLKTRTVLQLGYIYYILFAVRGAETLAVKSASPSETIRILDVS